MPRQKHFAGEMCETCGEQPKRYKGQSTAGTDIYGKDCNSCHKGMFDRPWLKFRGSSCEMCNYTPFFPGSLDVHHIDGDKNNNDPSNLSTLCATCHRELHQMENHLDGDIEKAKNMLKRFLKAVL